MPLELAAELPPDDDELVAAEPPDELDDWVEAGAEDVLDELEEFEPQAATARATSTIASGASRRNFVRVCEFMNRSFTSWESSRSSP